MLCHWSYCLSWEVLWQRIESRCIKNSTKLLVTFMPFADIPDSHQHSHFYVGVLTHSNSRRGEKWFLSVFALLAADHHAMRQSHPLSMDGNPAQLIWSNLTIVCRAELWMRRYWFISSAGPRVVAPMVFSFLPYVDDGAAWLLQTSVGGIG